MALVANVLVRPLGCMHTHIKHKTLKEEMVQSDFLTEYHTGIKLVPESSAANAHIWLIKDNEDFTACVIDVTAHFRSESTSVIRIAHTVCTAMNLHKTFCFKVRSL